MVSGCYRLHWKLIRENIINCNIHLYFGLTVNTVYILRHVYILLDRFWRWHRSGASRLSRPRNQRAHLQNGREAPSPRTVRSRLVFCMKNVPVFWFTNMRKLTLTKRKGHLMFYVYNIEKCSDKGAVVDSSSLLCVVQGGLLVESPLCTNREGELHTQQQRGKSVPRASTILRILSSNWPV